MVGKLYGLDWNALQNERTWEDFLAIVHSEDRQQVIDAIQSHIESGIPHDVEFRVIAVYASIHWMRSVGQAECDSNNKPIICGGLFKM